MGFRNPFRIQVDDNDVAYVTDYSPDSNTPENFRGPAGTGRVEVVRKASNYGWPLCVLARSCRTTAGTSTRPRRWTRRLRRTSAATPTAARRTARAGTPAPTSIPPASPAASTCRRSPSRTSGTRTATTPTRRSARRAWRTTTAPAAAARSCFPELYTTGVAPHGAAPYRYDASNPSTTKFPPYYDGAFILGEFNVDTLREVRVDADDKIFKINRFLDCGAALCVDLGVPVRVRQPDGHAVRHRRQLLPADLRRRLLPVQPRRGHVPLGVRQGPARAAGDDERHADQRHRSAQRAVLQRRLARPRPGRLDPLRVGLRRQRHGRLDRSRTRRTSTRPTASTCPS